MTGSSLLFAPGGALRAPWRIAIFAAATLLGWAMADVFVAPGLIAASSAVGLNVSVDGWLAVFGLLVGHVVALRVVDKRPWSAVWMGRGAARPAAWVEGWLLGALAIGVPCLTLLAAHQLRWAPAGAGSWMGAAARVSWFLLPAALLEELLTRGYLFSVLREALGWPAALGVTSVGFGLLHLANNGATVESVTLVTLAGVFLGVVVLATGSLYAAWMAHFAWNWTMAVALHSAVSGFPLDAPNYRMVDAGPAWLTGGAWGPEGGLAAAVGMMAALTYLYARRRRREES